MTNYPIPTAPKPTAATLRMVSQNFTAQSPFTYQQQVLNHPGRRWEIDISLPPMRRDDVAEWQAWLALLDGSLNTFTMGDPLAAIPRGEAGGTPLVDGADQTGSTLDVDGASVSETNWLRAGDYIQLGTGSDARLYMVTQDADTDGSGAVTLSIWPSLRATPSDNDPVIVSGAVGAFRLASGTSQWTEQGARFYSLSFSGVGVV